MDTVNAIIPAMESSFEMPREDRYSLKFKPEIYRQTENSVIPSASATKTIPIMPLKSEELVEEDLHLPSLPEKTLVYGIQLVNKSVELLFTGQNNCNVLLFDIKQAFEVLSDYLTFASPAEEELVETLQTLIEYNELILAWIKTENRFLLTVKGALGTVSKELFHLSSVDKYLVDALGSLNSSIKLILAEQKTQTTIIEENKGVSVTIFKNLPISSSAVQELVDALKSQDALINQFDEEKLRKTIFLVEMSALLDAILSQQSSLETRLSNLNISGLTDIKNPSTL